MNSLLYSLTMLVAVAISFVYELSVKKDYDRIEIANCYKIGDFKHIFRVPYKPNKSLYIYIAFLTIILSIFSATLDNVWSSDRNVYIGVFNTLFPKVNNVSEFGNVLLKTINEYGKNYGYGFVFLGLIIRTFTDNFYWLFFINTAIFASISFYALSKLRLNIKYTTIMIFLFISPFIYYNLYLLRQSIAVAFSFLAIVSIMDNRKLKFFVYVFIAFLFHGTALIVFIYFFITRLEIKKMNIFLFIVTIVMFVSFSNISDLFIAFLSSSKSLSKYLVYFGTKFLGEKGYRDYVLALRGIPFFILLTLALIKRKKLINIIPETKYYIASLWMCSISYLMSFHIYWLFRVSWYFLLPALAFIPKLLSTIKCKFVRFALYSLLFILFIVIYFRVAFITLGS